MLPITGQLKPQRFTFPRFQWLLQQRSRCVVDHFLHLGGNAQGPGIQMFQECFCLPSLQNRTGSLKNMEQNSLVTHWHVFPNKNCQFRKVFWKKIQLIKQRISGDGLSLHQVIAWGFFWDRNSYLRDAGKLRCLRIHQSVDMASHDSCWEQNIHPGAQDVNSSNKSEWSKKSFKKRFLKVMMMKFCKLGAKRLMICLPACDNVEMTNGHKSLLSLTARMKRMPKITQRSPISHRKFPFLLFQVTNTCLVIDISRTASFFIQSDQNRTLQWCAFWYFHRFRDSSSKKSQACWSQVWRSLTFPGGWGLELVGFCCSSHRTLNSEDGPTDDFLVEADPNIFVKVSRGCWGIRHKASENMPADVHDGSLRIDWIAKPTCKFQIIG